MNKLFSRILTLVLAVIALSSSAQNVSRNISDLNAFPWKQEWSTAKGSFKRVKDVPSGADIDKKSSNGY